MDDWVINLALMADGFSQQQRAQIEAKLPALGKLLNDLAALAPGLKQMQPTLTDAINQWADVAPEVQMLASSITGVKATKALPNGSKFKLGRKRPLVRGPRLHLKNYLYRSLPSPPLSVPVINDYALFKDILDNGDIGDCTIAAAFHITGALLSSAGTPIEFGLNADNAKALYFQLTGGQDTGLDEQLVLNHWQKNGLLPNGAHQATAWCAVNAADDVQMRTAIALFGNVYFGVELPDQWLDFAGQGGFVWGVEGDPDPENGHAFAGLGYDAGGVIVNSWGMEGQITWEACAKYASGGGGGECYTVLSPDILKKIEEKSPAGFDLSQLKADIQAVNG